MHDIHLHYIEKGSGKPLILLHGNGEDSRYFKHQIRFFPVAAEYWRWIPEDTEKRKEGQSLLRSGSLRRILPFS